MANFPVKMLESRRLVPAAWLNDGGNAGELNFRVFNPTITALDDGYALCYRVVEDGSDYRKLAACRLDDQFDVVPGSVTALSDLIEFARPQNLNPRALAWHADPRYFRLGSRLFLYWNDGGNRPVNNQFLAEMTEDGLTPAGKARLLTSWPRRQIEKNWMLFEDQGDVYGIYSISPFSILKFDLDRDDVLNGEKRFLGGWSSAYESFYGVLRGSAQPLRIKDSFLCLAHSSFKISTGRIYCAAFYRFSGQAPFKMESATSEPFELPNPKGFQFDFPRLNPDVQEVIYPCGMVEKDGQVVISYGINDESCAIAVVPLETIESSLKPVKNSFLMNADAPPMAKVSRASNGAGKTAVSKEPIPLMWWDAAGKKFDGNIGDRKFRTGNFGDIASRDIVETFLGRPTRQAIGKERKLICIGSVIHTAAHGDIVWGAGMKGNKAQLDQSVKELDVRAVRGPLTLEMLRRHGIDISKVNHLFDPGCLMPFLYPKELKAARASAEKFDFKIIPHYRDDMVLRRTHYRLNKHFISVDCTPIEMMKAICGADRVISSSLHGIIFAESLGIPAVWLAPVGGEDELKYYDYYYGTGRMIVKRFTNLDDAIRAEPMPLPRFDFEGYARSFPKDAILGLHHFGLRANEPFAFTPANQPKADEYFMIRNMTYFASKGLWGTSKYSRVSTNFLASAGENFIATVEISPFNPENFVVPQAIAVSLNGGPTTEIEWGKGGVETMSIDLPFVASGPQTAIEFIFRARNCRSPKSFGISNITNPMTFRLNSLTISKP